MTFPNYIDYSFPKFIDYRFPKYLKYLEYINICLTNNPKVSLCTTAHMLIIKLHSNADENAHVRLAPTMNIAMRL